MWVSWSRPCIFKAIKYLGDGPKILQEVCDTVRGAIQALCIPAWIM